MRKIIFLAACAAAGSVSAATFTVGDTVQDSCDFATIQEAIDTATLNAAAQDQILVANTGSYADQVLQIGDASLIVEGGYDSCQHLGPAPAADIGGNGVDTVLRIAPAQATRQFVTLHGLRLHGGGSFGLNGSVGGGIYVTNNVTLTIADTSIDGNSAASGGGIYIDGDTGAPVAELDAGTRIHDNHAQYYGGGVYLEAGQLQIEADEVQVDHNRADDAGGGIASIGGKVLVGSFGNATARHDATGASVSSNTAGAVGGGIFLSGSFAALTANELIVDSNISEVSGAGIAAIANATVSMARDYATGPALQCPNARQCSRISNNRLGAVHGTVGGAIELHSGAFANIAQTIVRDNVAVDGSVAFVDGATLFFEGVLASANQTFDTPSRTGVAIRTQFQAPAPNAHVRIAYSTFAGNLRQTSTQNVAAIDITAQKDTQLSIYSSVFEDAYYPITAYSAYTDDCVVNGTGGKDAFGTHTRFTAPANSLFVDTAAGDYRPRRDSVLNDYCDASPFVASFRDLMLTPRCNDDPAKGNAYGACDAGAYESDQIFGDGLQ